MITSINKVMCNVDTTVALGKTSLVALQIHDNYPQ